jgi:hypothetical protein
VWPGFTDRNLPEMLMKFNAESPATDGADAFFGKGGIIQYAGARHFVALRNTGD